MNGRLLKVQNAGKEPASNPLRMPVLLDRLQDASKTAKDLVSIKRALAIAGREKEEEAAKEALAILKEKGFVGPEVEKAGKSRVTGLIDTMLCSLMEKINPVREIDDVKGGRLFANLEGRMVAATDAYKLQASDPSGELERNPRMARALEVFQKACAEFRPDPIEKYKAFAVVNGELAGISIDDGKHKQAICLLCPSSVSEPVLAFYAHYEHGEGQCSGNRIRYLMNALSSLNFSRDVKRRSERACAVYGLRLLEVGWERAVFDLVRLSKSVKDLDFSLITPESAELAARLFADGVTNMCVFLGALGCVDGKLPGKIKWLNPQENQKLAECFEVRKRFGRVAEEYKKTLVLSRKAKQLNFAVLKEITELQGLMQKCGSESVSASRVRGSFSRIESGLKEMAETCERIDAKQHGEYRQKAGEIIGNCKPLISKSRVLTEADAERISRFFTGKPGQLKLEQVETLEEMARFLHASSISAQYARARMVAVKAGDADALLLSSGLSILNFVSLSISADPEEALPYAIFKKTVERMPLYVRNQFKAEFGSVTPPVAVFGDDFAELSLPFGKHYAEIRADVDDLNKCYVIGLSYFETDYANAPSRSAFVRKVLGKLGFTLNEPGRILQASFRTHEKSAWEEAYGELIRLMFSAKDLDLGCDPDLCADLFKRGATNLRMVDADACMLTKKEGGENVSEYEKILHRDTGHCGRGELVALTEVFMEQYDFRPSEIVPLLKGFSAKDLEEITFLLFELEGPAKKARDKKRLGQLRRLEKALDALPGREDGNALDQD